MNESALRGLVRALLRESIDIQTDDVYVLCSMIRRFYSEDDLWDWMNTLDKFLSGPAKSDLDQSVQSDLDNLHGALTDVIFSDDFIGWWDDYVNVVKALSNVSDYKVKRAVFETIMKYPTDLIKNNDSIVDLFGDIDFHMTRAVEGDTMSGRVKRADIVVRKIQALMKLVADLDTSSKRDYVEHMRAMARIKAGNLSGIDPEYLEQAAEIIIGGEGGVPQALELISML